MKYKNWTVLSPDKVNREGRVYYRCKCVCGVEKEVIIKNLKSGISTNCGCLRKKKLVDRNTKHGLRFTQTWRAWQAMKTRCYNKNIRWYHNYGGRGIKVCDRWKNDFVAFHKDVGDAPKDKSLDRINNDGDYTPDNVRWATRKEQANNRRTCKQIK